MKNKQDGGFSLIEVVLAMVILALIVVPTCTSLVLSFRVNAKAEALLQAQLAVSSAVEELMAKGITDDYVASLTAETGEDGLTYYYSSQFADLRFELTDEGDYYSLTVMDREELVSVDTDIRDYTTSDNKLEEVPAA